MIDGAGRVTIEKVLANGKEFSRTKHTHDGDSTLVEPPAGASAIREKVDARRLDKASSKVEATRYYSHSGQTVAVRTTAGLTWTAPDHNGTASVQVDAATQTVTRRQMKPFGEDRGQAAKAWVGERGFVGGTKEPTGLTHLGAREYDPSTGRFVNVDPVIDLTDPQQVNGYSYSSNNPVTFADPDGKFRASAIRLASIDRQEH